MLTLTNGHVHRYVTLWLKLACFHKELHLPSILRINTTRRSGDN